MHRIRISGTTTDAQAGYLYNKIQKFYRYTDMFHANMEGSARDQKLERMLLRPFSLGLLAIYLYQLSEKCHFNVS